MINLNGDQKRVMSACASMCTTNLTTPQAAIIQGPPGTGKSTTVAAMVLQIIFRWRKMNNNPNCPLPRILITAPSNAAVDEIVKKLLACRQRLGKDDRFNMMRIGNLRAIHPEVQNISLEKLKEINLKSANARGSTIQSLDLEINARNKRIEELTKKIERKELNNDDELKLYHRQVRIILESGLIKFQDFPLLFRSRRKYQKETLQNIVNELKLNIVLMVEKCTSKWTSCCSMLTSSPLL